MRTGMSGIRCRLIALIALSAISADALGAQGGRRSDPSIPAVVDLHTLDELNPGATSRPERFYVRHPDAATSEAWLDDSRLADKAGRIPDPVGGFELTNRIIVQARRPEIATALVLDYPNLSIEPLRPAHGYWVLTASSVREAAAIATKLAARGEDLQISLDMARPRTERDLPNDPSFPSQWHLRNTQQELFDVNAEAAWGAGYTGAGVVIGIVERAWQHDHPDLAANYNAEASQTGGSLSSHATSVAGIAGAVGNNNLFGVGAAYGAQLSNQFYGTDSEVAAAFAYRNDLNDIKSNSWGPLDIGQIAYLAPIVRDALEEAATTGRGGLGEVFVWAGGNGGSSSDRVDYDPFASSRYTIAVGAIGDLDYQAGYSEDGSSLVLVTQSSGNVRMISTTTSGSGWTSSFGGTSAAAPLAAGVVALMLEANPDLTWRDVQHVLIESARINDPNHPDWTTNGAGYAINYSYGFGAIDAGAAVVLAKDWTRVPHELSVDTGVVAVNTQLPDADPNGATETIDITDNIRIETVELILNAQTTFVGDLQIVLTSPSGTESVLAERRASDPQNNYVDYLFTSFRHWGEESAGQWTIHIADRAPGDLATWVDCRLVFHGTPVCVGDLSGDGVIGVTDLIELLAAYYTCEGDQWFEPAADHNNDACIDISDLGYLLSIYGTSCP